MFAQTDFKPVHTGLTARSENASIAISMLIEALANAGVTEVRVGEGKSVRIHKHYAELRQACASDANSYEVFMFLREPIKPWLEEPRCPGLS